MWHDMITKVYLRWVRPKFYGQLWIHLCFKWLIRLVKYAKDFYMENANF